MHGRRSASLRLEPTAGLVPHPWVDTRNRSHARQSGVPIKSATVRMSSPGVSALPVAPPQFALKSLKCARQRQRAVPELHRFRDLEPRQELACVFDQFLGGRLHILPEDDEGVSGSDAPTPFPVCQGSAWLGAAGPGWDVAGGAADGATPTDRCSAATSVRAEDTWDTSSTDPCSSSLR